mmetsp:Transcript_17249/g.37390  ORF Transcript_17249/g.37390 Transcript_17249/m.37390 type:complete len:118 (-) Transcript_17249:61-414(-)
MKRTPTALIQSSLPLVALVDSPSACPIIGEPPSKVDAEVLLPSLHAELAASRSLAAALPRDYVPYLDPSSLSSSALSPLLSEPPTTATTDSDVPIWQPFVCILLQVVVVICCCKRRR